MKINYKFLALIISLGGISCTEHSNQSEHAIVKKYEESECSVQVIVVGYRYQESEIFFLEDLSGKELRTVNLIIDLLWEEGELLDFGGPDIGCIDIVVQSDDTYREVRIPYPIDRNDLLLHKDSENILLNGRNSNYWNNRFRERRLAVELALSLVEIEDEMIAYSQQSMTLWWDSSINSFREHH